MHACIRVCVSVSLCVFLQCQWLLSAQCLMQLISCACRWLKQSINVGLQLPQNYFQRTMTVEEQSHLMFISCCTVWAFRGGSGLAWFRDCLCLRTNVYPGKCVSVCFCMWVYVLAWQQIAVGECAISRTFSLLVQSGGCVWKQNAGENLLLGLFLIVHCSHLVQTGIIES